MLFLDKIQNINERDISIMIEGVRRSIKEKGYYLAIPPFEIDDDVSISNDLYIRQFIKKHIALSDSDLFTKFKPYSHAYDFSNPSSELYSRANHGLSVRPVLPMKLVKGLSITPGIPVQSWRTSNVNLKNLIKEESSDLKNGSVEDKIRYIHVMHIAKQANIYEDPQFEFTLQSWLKDKSESFKLRKQVFYL